MIKTFRLFCFFLAFLLTLEFCARLEATWQWGAPFWGLYSFETLTINDAMGRRNRPFAHFEKWAINSHGFQGPELQIPKPTGITRIGVAGASEIFGLYESPGNDITSQLRKMLESSVPDRFEVVNLATSGMSIPRIIEYYEMWIRKFDFDAILYYPSPAMYLEGKEPDFRRDGSGMTSQQSASEPHGWNLRLPGKTWDMLRERLPDRLQVELKRYQIEKQRRKHPKVWVWERYAPKERLSLFREHLLELIQILEKDGICVIIATHANRFLDVSTEEDRKQMVSWIRFYPRASGESLLDMERKANQILWDLSDNNNISIVDVENAVGKNPDHYADFVHFSDLGASLAAKAMRDKILTLFP